MDYGITITPGESCYVRHFNCAVTVCVRPYSIEISGQIHDGYEVAVYTFDEDEAQDVWRFDDLKEAVEAMYRLADFIYYDAERRYNKRG